MTFETLGDLNWLAVLVGAVVYFTIGGLWYSPVLFAKPWQAATGVNPQAATGPNPALFVITFVLELVASTVLAWIAATTGASTVGHGLVLGLAVGVGIALVVLAITFSYENRPRALYFYDGGYHVVALTVVGIIVTIWD